MAVHDEDTKVAAQTQTQAAPKQQQQSRGFNNSWSFHDQSLYAAPINRGLGSETYNQMKDLLSEIFKQGNDAVEFALIDLDSSEERALAFSAIVVAMRHKRQPELGVAWHVLLLEATGEKISPLYETINGQQVEIMRATSQAIDSVMHDIAVKKLKVAFSTGPWHYTEGTVIPVDFNVTERSSVHKIALNTAMACWTELQRHDNSFADLNLARITNDSQLGVNVAFSRNQVTDAVNHPIRSDINVILSSKKNNQNNNQQSINNGDREVRISELSAYVELVWDPVYQQNIFNPYYNQQQQNTQRYSARLVVTNLNTNINCTIGSVLLAASTSLSLRDDNNWMQVFRPSPIERGNNIVDLADIGAINIEANLTNDQTQSGWGKRIETKGQDFKLQDLGQMIAALVRPGLIISIDCPENAPQSHYTSVFAAGAGGSDIAYGMIYDAAEALTDGNFKKRFAHGSQMFVDTNNRVHNGYYIDRSGQRRDIRDIDNLAVCNLVGATNPETIKRYSETYLNTTIPLSVRLADRKKIIMAMSGDQAVFTGFSQRVTFSAAFMEALAAGIREAGLNVRITTPLSNADFNSQRGVASFSQQALLAPGQSSTFMTAGGFNGYGGQQMPYYVGGRY